MTTKEYYNRNADSLRAKAREYYLANRDRRIAYSKEYVVKNKEKVRAKEREYYQKHKEKRKASAAKWSAANRDKVNIWRKATRGQSRALIANWKASGCSQCGAKDNIHAHHVRGIKKFNIAQAGDRAVKTVTVELAKCVPLCRNCHIALHASVRRTPLPQFHRSSA